MNSDPPATDNDSFDIRERSRSRQRDQSVIDYLKTRSIGGQKSLLGTKRQYVNVAPQTTLYEQETLDYVKKFSLTGNVSLFCDTLGLLTNYI